MTMTQANNNEFINDIFTVLNEFRANERETFTLDYFKLRLIAHGLKYDPRMLAWFVSTAKEYGWFKIEKRILARKESGKIEHAQMVYVLTTLRFDAR